MEAKVDDSSMGSGVSSKSLKHGADGQHRAAEYGKAGNGLSEKNAPTDQQKSSKTERDILEKADHSNKKPDGDSADSNRKGTNLEKIDKKGTEKDSSSSFKRGSLVWVHIKGFPWWPGMIVKEADVPDDKKKVSHTHQFHSGMIVRNFEFVVNMCTKLINQRNYGMADWRRISPRP